jgi:hypothetical protein
MSPAIQGDYISDLLGVVSPIIELPGGLFEVEVLTGPVAGAYVSKQLTAEQLVEYLRTKLGASSLQALHTFRFRTQAEAVGNYGGETLDQLDYSTLFTAARVLVELWRDNPADLTSGVIYGQELIAVYDPNADAQHQGWRTSGGAAANAGQIGLKLVKIENPNAVVVRQYDAAQVVAKGEVRYYDDGQGVQFYEAVRDLASPVPLPTRGQATADWKPVKPPGVPGAGAAPALTLTTDLVTVQQDLLAQPLRPLTEGVRYNIAGDWNGQGDQVVYVQAATATTFEKVGTLQNPGYPDTAVEVDVPAGTAVPAGGGNLADFAKKSEANEFTRSQTISDAGGGSVVLQSDRIFWTLSAGAFKKAASVQLYLGGANGQKAIFRYGVDTVELPQTDPNNPDSAVTVAYLAQTAGAGTVKAINGLAPDAAGNVELPTRDVYDVAAAKRLDVADALINQVAAGGQAMLRELDDSFVGQVFKDNRDPANPYRYTCDKEANASTGAPEYYWNRTRIR